MPAGRPTVAEIDLDAVVANFRLARAAADCQMLAVVKADAYGHGAAHVAPALEAAGAALFGVALAEEGIALRQAGVRRPILILGGTYPGQEEDLLRYELTPTLIDLETARRLAACFRAAGRRCRCHLKFDTGMGRVGFQPAELDATLAALCALPEIEIEGVFSHLAVADELANPFTDEQVRRFRAVLDRVRAAGLRPRYVHLANSAALFSRELPECNLARPGIVLYGALPSDDFVGRLDLRPAMSLTSRIAHLKKVPAGTGVSYGHRYVSTGEALIAAVPIGYADGYNRLLSSRGEALVRGRRVRVAGAVCMDWTLFDVTGVTGVAVGDRITLLGADGDDAVSAEEWAKRIGTIPYEVFCGISRRVPRRFHGEGA